MFGRHHESHEHDQRSADRDDHQQQEAGAPSMLAGAAAQLGSGALQRKIARRRTEGHAPPAPQAPQPLSRDEKRELKQLMRQGRLETEQIARVRSLIARAPVRDQGDLYEKLQSKVPYENQRDNRYEGKETGTTCNLSSLSMCLRQLGVPNPHPEMQYPDALEKVRLKHGLPAKTEETGWGGVAKALGVTVMFLAKEGAQKRDFWLGTVLPHIRAGHSVMMSISGHIIRLQDVTKKGLVVDDPYGRTILGAGQAFGFEAINDGWKKEKGGKAFSPEAKANRTGEDRALPWDQVEPHTMRWIAAFSK